MSARAYDCLLALALPASLEEEVLDHLHAHPEWVGGFTVARADGYGEGAGLHSAMEKVLGRARRRVVTVLIERSHAQALLDSLRAQFRSAEIAYWVVPVLEFGRFA